MPLGWLAFSGDGWRMGRVIAFVPASGGVGASTLCAAVAVRAAAAGRSVVAVDLDAVGGRLDVVLGVEQEPGWRWDRLAGGDGAPGVSGVVDGHALARELPSVAGVGVLTGWPVVRVPAPSSGPFVPQAAQVRDGPSQAAAAGAGRRPRSLVPDVVAGLAEAHDVTVLDLPRDAAVIAAVAPLVHAWVVVVGAHVPQLGAAAVTVPWLRGLVGRSGPNARASDLPWVVLRGAGAGDEISDAVADHLDVAVVGSLRDDVRLATDITLGHAPGTRGRGAVVEVADELLLRLTSLGDHDDPRAWRWSA
jgi:MinD-like ATPase involved in chromosome partitioning or flagellar assembly